VSTRREGNTMTANLLSKVHQQETPQTHQGRSAKKKNPSHTKTAANVQQLPSFYSRVSYLSGVYNLGQLRKQHTRMEPGGECGKNKKEERKGGKSRRNGGKCRFRGIYMNHSRNACNGIIKKLPHQKGGGLEQSPVSTLWSLPKRLADTQIVWGKI